MTGYEAFTTADNLRLTGLGEPVPSTGIEVTENFFQVLGVQPATGRLFTPHEVRGGPHPVALLTNSYWQRQFNGDPAIVGRSIELDGMLFTVLDVLPASFDFGAVFSPGSKVDLFLPLDLNKERDCGNIVTLLGRLSYLMMQRTGEIGVRMALGAQREQVLGLMLGDGLRPALYGLMLGLAASAGAVRLIQTMLYGTGRSIRRSLRLWLQRCWW